jgi:dTDP-4-dehydrorhamnose 3,5-epimerase
VKLVETPLGGAFVIELEPQVDERGMFARTFDRAMFANAGLDPVVDQCSVSFNHRAGTLRGLHYQAAPHQEAKLVRCIAGAIHDVIVDLRADSPTYLRWHAVNLDATTRNALYVPPGCAHGFLTLVDNAEVLYQISRPFVPEAARGVRWDDPKLGIRWPMQPTTITARDRAYDLL